MEHEQKRQLPTTYTVGHAEMDMYGSFHKGNRYVRHASQQLWLCSQIVQGSLLGNETAMSDGSGLSRRRWLAVCTVWDMEVQNSRGGGR